MYNRKRLTAEVNTLTFLETQFIRTEKEKQLFKKAKDLSAVFFERADLHDRHATFPFDNFEDLKKEGFLSLTIPETHGGEGISLYTFLLLQEKLAEGDPATALSLGWHLGLFLSLRETGKWKPELFNRITAEVVQSGKLVNSAASEAKTGSPARGGKPETTAVKQGDHWVINGKKIFASLAPILDYFIVTATIEGTGDIGEFLVPREADGVRIEETWDTMGMRGTRSDDLILDQVRLESSAWIGNRSKQAKPMSQGWLLHIPACYLGIAIAARNEAVRFARVYHPNSLPHPIMEVPEVRRKVAEMDIKLLSARQLMYAMAEKWDENPGIRTDLQTELAAAKYVATNAAVEVVDLAMRIEGGQSLFRNKPLERFYRDVRAGLHNPPSDDITIKIMADRAFSETE
ncbi:acyl-CoA dehydrogenase [Bacillus sp. FJAT-42376]|uniref:acyl-CoA dehydrogenase family protein n=1 Tax=Bacillus sp. FJAT-42376 TaxID=2014076 RepID=UPI000F4D487D|nr:acyl-CoA dehydrogenase family protein [Bacillus sp. FJAT-42376]AZB42664.1 acyl-CoA dehydrogenase [Bacillus sp. FJAT-42376]